MDFTYTGSGSITLHGCPEVEFDYILTFKYNIGSKVYDALLAAQGVFESCVVRKVWFVNDPRTGIRKALYKDQHNWLHNEYDLCSQSEAIALVTAYYENKQVDINAVLESLNC
jgi:hypothetical protein